MNLARAEDDVVKEEEDAARYLGICWWRCGQTGRLLPVYRETHLARKAPVFQNLNSRVRASGPFRW